MWYTLVLIVPQFLWESAFKFIPYWKESIITYSFEYLLFVCFKFFTTNIENFNFSSIILQET
jgi:hypothetical protein